VETDNTLPRKLVFLVPCLLIAANLAVFSIRLAQNASFESPKKAVRQDAAAVRRNVDDSIRTVASTTGQAVKVAAAISNVGDFIRPVSDAKVPVITPAAPISVPGVSPALALTSATVPQNVLPSVSVPATIDAYAWGNCTWWASMRRAQIGDPIPNTWGNAATWAVRAARGGYTVDHHPTPGAIMQLSNTAGGLGHVAFVESVDPDGSWHISEMNVLGLNVIDHKTEPPAAAGWYNFIHDRT